MSQLIAIALGGSVGAVARFLVANGIYAWLGRGFPHGTLFVNLSGSLLMGLVTELMLQRFALAVEYRAALLVGFMGAYTTFSTFALETLYLFEEGSLLKAFLNIFLNTILSVAAVWVGLIWGRVLFTQDLYPWLGHGLPYSEWGLGLLFIFFGAGFAGYAFEWLAVGSGVRAVTLISLLGLSTVLSTLWVVLRLVEIRFEFQGLLVLFAINALLGVGMAWFGHFMGQWLWQLNPLR